MNKKFLTKLLHQDFRNQVLQSISQFKIDKYKIRQYARYVVDSCIINRSQKYVNCKEYNYGFSPIQFLCAVKKNGIDKKLFEFNSVNHFLRKTDGNSAVEVVICILVKWIHEDREIIDFDIDIIDSELSKAEAAFKKQLESEVDNVEQLKNEDEK